MEDDEAFDEHHDNYKNKGLTPYESFVKFAKESDKLYYAYLKPDRELIVVTDYKDEPFRLYKFKKQMRV